MSAIRLFEITEQLVGLERLALTEEIPPEVIADTLEGLTGDFKAKVLQVAKFILSLDANANAIEDAASAMKQRASHVRRRADSVRAYLLYQMQTVDCPRIESAELVVRRARNPVAVQIRDEGSIPASFWVQPEPPPLRLDKRSLKEALQRGETIEGAYLESGERLEIKL